MGFTWYQSTNKLLRLFLSLFNASTFSLAFLTVLSLSNLSMMECFSSSSIAISYFHFTWNAACHSCPPSSCVFSCKSSVSRLKLARLPFAAYSIYFSWYCLARTASLRALLWSRYDLIASRSCFEKLLPSKENSVNPNPFDE